jgi:hypothetical protein
VIDSNATFPQSVDSGASDDKSFPDKLHPAKALGEGGGEGDLEVSPKIAVVLQDFAEARQVTEPSDLCTPHCDQAIQTLR